MSECVVCYKKRCSYATCQYCNTIVCRKCTLHMLRLYKNGYEFKHLRYCPQCRQKGWAIKKDGSSIVFLRALDYDISWDSLPYPSPIASIYKVLFGWVYMFIVFCGCVYILKSLNYNDQFLFMTCAFLVPVIKHIVVN